MNPDDAIVRTNARQTVTGLAADSQVFDAPYLVSLSADAVPALVEILPELDETQRRDLARGLLRRWNGATSNDWRTFAWGRYRAVAVLNDNREMLLERAGPLDIPPPRIRKASAALISAAPGGWDL